MPSFARGCHPEAGQGQDGAPPWEVADILRLYGPTYWAAYPVPPRHQKVMDDIIACRTAALGGHAEPGRQCGFERYAYNSCRNRHCPKCQTLRKEQWLADRKAELLPVPYFHCVFTLPHELNPLVLCNKRARLTLLFRATSQTLLQFGHHNLGGQLGGLLLFHTWEQTLKAHFHVHALVPGGALAPAGTCWTPTSPRFLFPIHALSAVFRGKLLALLRQSKETLAGAKPTAPLTSASDFQRLLDSLYAKSWVIYAKRPMAGPEQVLDYLGRYTHRVAIANHRIVEVKEGQVRFTFRNRSHSNRVETMTLPAHEFIRRLLLHVLPHGFQRLRHIGFLANRCKAQALRQCRQLLHQPEPPRPQQKTVVEWIGQLTGTDLTRCPQCGQGPLQRLPLAPLSLRRGQPGAPPVWDSS